MLLGWVCALMIVTRELVSSYRLFRPNNVFRIAPRLRVSQFSCKSSSAPRPDISKEINEKYFDYAKLEPVLYDWWKSQGYFKPSDDPAKSPFVISMPPPNVTGYLHMGHAMFVTLQDLLIRFQRMRGKSVLWVPGT